MDRNQQSYALKKIVEKYKHEKGLQPAEKVIFKKYEAEIRTAKVLDIGIGGGRTTEYLLPLCHFYTGVDYSNLMVAACKEKFSSGNARFEVCDARKMERFAGDQFDVVLFSFNGLDSVGKEDRTAVLREIKRVGKPNSLFIFSSHNLRKMDDLFRFRFSPNPVKLCFELFRFAKFRKLNEPKTSYLKKDWAVLIDGAEVDFLYIKPEVQVKELEALGFSGIQLYSNKTGANVPLNEIETYKNAWIYFTCRIS